MSNVATVNGQAQVVDFEESSSSERNSEMSKRMLTRKEKTGVKLYLLNAPSSTFYKWAGEVISAAGLTFNKTQHKSFCSLLASNYLDARSTMRPAQAKEEVVSNLGFYEYEAKNFYYL